MENKSIDVNVEAAAACAAPCVQSESDVASASAELPGSPTHPAIAADSYIDLQQQQQQQQQQQPQHKQEQQASPSGNDSQSELLEKLPQVSHPVVHGKLLAHQVDKEAGEKDCSACGSQLQDMINDMRHAMEVHFSHQADLMECLKKQLAEHVVGVETASPSAPIGKPPVWQPKAAAHFSVPAESQSPLIEESKRQPPNPSPIQAPVRHTKARWTWYQSATTLAPRRVTTAVAQQLRSIMQHSNTMATQPVSGGGTVLRNGVVVDIETTCMLKAWLALWISSRTFDAVMGCLIVFNSLLIGYQADQRIRHPGREDAPAVFALDKVFTGIFTVEIVVRILVFGKQFFCGPEWRFNVFDLVIVLSSLMEELIDVVDIIFLRVLRNMKLVRVFRVFRTLEFFRELRMMMLSIAACMRSLFWILFLLLVVMYMFAVGIIMCVYEEIERSPDARYLFGTLGQSLLTLFQAITGGINWGEITDALGEIDVIPTALFIVYLAFVLFAVMNIMTGFFVEQAMKAAETDLENMINEEIHDRQRVVANLRLFLESSAHREHNGVITWEELNEKLSIPSVQAYFKTLRLETSDLRNFFQLVGADGKDMMSIDSLVRCCMRLKGPARSSDLLLMRHELEVYTNRIMQALGSADTSSGGHQKRRTSGQGSIRNTFHSSCESAVASDTVLRVD